MDKNLTAVAESAGIVGAGGAGFPTHVKLAGSADTVIINGAECEPLLRVDQQLMARDAKKLLEALSLVVEQVGASRGVVALKEKYHEAVDAIKRELAAYPKLEIFLMGSFYPAGDEQVLVCEVTGRIVPEGGIPINVGVVVMNVETALNLYAAYTDGAPVTDKYVTIGGAVARPTTVYVPLGITVAEAIALAGGATVADYTVINGGPMMGAVVSPESRVTKTTKGLLVIPSDSPLIHSLKKDLRRMLKDAGIACMQCSMCSEVCPRGLLNHRIQPHKLMRLAGYSSTCDESVTPLNAWLCCGCRLCEYACVMQLQPWKLNGNLKGVMGKNGIKNTLNNKPDKPAPFREYKRYPVHKLIRQLGLADYDVPAPMSARQPDFKKVALPLKQNVGAPSSPVVKVGDVVKKGDLIAKIPDKALGANLHASIAGRVTDIGESSITIEA